MAFVARRLVSKNKRRLQEDGFDLDLTYITPCIIAMGFPAADVLRGLYRNRMADVRRLLETRHAGCYKVYNLCIEQGHGYDASLIGCPVERLPIFDGQVSQCMWTGVADTPYHSIPLNPAVAAGTLALLMRTHPLLWHLQPAPLHMVHEVCQDALTWLSAKECNVVAVHCKAGKGRTGTIICALLLHLMKHRPELLPASLRPDSAQGPCPSTQDLEAALRHYDVTRTYNGRGLTIPSQRACVQRYAAALQLPHAQRLQLLLTPAPVQLHQVCFSDLPSTLLSNFTLGIWERPTGSYAYRLVCFVHGRSPAAGVAACLGSAADAEPSTAANQHQGTQQQARNGQVSHAPSTSARQSGTVPAQQTSAESAAPGTGAGFEEYCGAHWPSRWGSMPTPRPQLHPTVSIDLKQKAFSLEFGSANGGGHALVEGDLKLQLFQGRFKLQGPPPYMHRTCPFFVWVSTTELQSQGEPSEREDEQNRGASRAQTRVAVVGQRQMNKVSKGLRQRGDRIKLHVHFECGS